MIRTNFRGLKSYQPIALAKSHNTHVCMGSGRQLY